MSQRLKIFTHHDINARQQIEMDYWNGNFIHLAVNCEEENADVLFSVFPVRRRPSNQLNRCAPIQCQSNLFTINGSRWEFKQCKNVYKYILFNILVVIVQYIKSVCSFRLPLCLCQTMNTFAMYCTSTRCKRRAFAVQMKAQPDAITTKTGPSRPTKKKTPVVIQ